MNTVTHRFFNCAAAFIFVFPWLVTSCAPTSTPTLFRPPTKSLPTEILPTTTSVPQIFTSTPETPTSSIPPTLTATPPCTNDLTFIADATIPDGTTVSPGSSIDKQWLVNNSGTCNWDERYRLKWIGGDPLGATSEQALYPARAGTEVTLRILFTASSDLGIYESAWQAFGPDGVAFGDPVFLKITVSP